MNSFKCAKCQEKFSKEEIIVNSGTEVWHKNCFSCAQCFRPFKQEDEFYEFENRKYCEYDFKILFAPSCIQCKEFIKGRIIKALNYNWHPDCFNCSLCKINLTEQGFIKNGNLALCHSCNSSIKTGDTNKFVCFQCSSLIDEKDLLNYHDQTYHAYHFNCSTCAIELNNNYREVKDELFCLKCHDRMGLPICYACHRPIEERVVTALGKNWHVEHFVCSKCEKPFLGSRYYEKKGLAYCEIHYHQLFGNLCFVCNKVISGDTFSALNKAWCVNHFECFFCNTKMNQKAKFYDVDLRPCCKKCFDKFPNDLKKRLKDLYLNKKRV